MALNFSTSTLDARRLKEHDFQPRILYPPKPLIKRKSRMAFLNIQDLETFTAYEFLLFSKHS